MTLGAGEANRTALDVSRETNERLEALAALLTKWNAAVNLVSKDTIARVWERHIVDSAQIFALGNSATSWVDMGSGGGFPGLVVAILAAEKRPQMQIALIESDQRKAAFLRQASLSLGISVKVVSERIEAVEPLIADVVSARALAPLPLLCAFASRHLAPNGTAIFLKGRNFQSEVLAAQERWKFSLESHQSVTDPSSSILVLKGIAHV